MWRNTSYLKYDWLYIHTNGSQHDFHHTDKTTETRCSMPAETQLILTPWSGHTHKNSLGDLNFPFVKFPVSG